MRHIRVFSSFVGNPLSGGKTNAKLSANSVIPVRRFVYMFYMFKLSIELMQCKGK